jgi:hypothetical protein
MSMLRKLTLALLPVAVPFVAGAADEVSSNRPDVESDQRHHSSDWRREPSPLVQKVRRATERYLDINVALDDHFKPGTPCVTGPNEGAMGVHFVRMDRLGDGKLDADEPEALIYEPLADGAMRLVGVEFIVFASAWEAAHKDAGAPSLEGHLMNYVGAPNRYGLDAFYELHVWAWEQNPKGSFTDWNTRVSCNRQQGES